MATNGQAVEAKKQNAHNKHACLKDKKLNH